MPGAVLCRAVWLALAGLLACRPVLAADPQPYALDVRKTGNDALDRAISDASVLASLRQSAPVGPFALVLRAQQDQQRFLSVLQGLGYYAGTARITIGGHPLDDPTLPDLIEAAPATPPEPVTVAITPGPLFHLRQLAIDGAVPPGVAGKLAPLAPGAPAVASDVLAAQSRLLDAMRSAGHPLAKLPVPVVTEDAGARVLDVVFHPDPGPFADLGPITLDGLDRVDPAYVRRRLTMARGQAFSPERIEAARRDLVDTGLFSTVRMQAADRLDADGQLPVTIDFVERPRHVVGLSALYSTDLGGSAGVTWTDRNLWGAGQRLDLKAAATQLGGTAVSMPGYDVGATLTFPDWLRRDQTLTLGLEALAEDLPAYSRTAGIATTSLTRKLNAQWTASIGLTGEQEAVIQDDQHFHYTLVELPLGLKYDSSNNLLDPTRGIRAAAVVTPAQSLGSHSDSFAILSASASTYLDVGDLLGFTDPGRSVLALRGQLGSVPGVSSLELPPDARFYAGGSATVRGYKYQTLGPHFGNNVPIGGTAIAAGTLEWRQRVLDKYGFAAFVDAGSVNSNGVPLGGQMLVGAGVGARYYTPFGPIRADIAVPLNRDPGNDSFEVYIGLGQAF